MRWNEWATPEVCATLAKRETDIYRVYTGSEGWAERLGDSALLSYHFPESLPSLIHSFETWQRQNGREIVRLYARHVPKRPQERMPNVLAWGSPLPSGPQMVREDGLRYQIELESGYAYGLYPDQRENRLYLRTLKPRKILNLFAYTCAFSVAAAREAADTVSIDLSKKSLERGKENFRLNGLDPASHFFFCGDVLKTLPRFQRQARTFDVIILDPPTFARGEDNRVFQVEKEMSGLIRLCLELLQPGAASLFVSTNCEQLGPPQLESWIQENIPSHRRLGRVGQAPAAVDLPEGQGPATVWAHLT